MEDSIRERYVDLPVVSPDANLKEVAQTLLDSEGTMVVVSKSENVYGYIDTKVLLKWFLMGEEGAKLKAGDLAILIRDEDRLESSVDIENIVEKVVKNKGLPLFVSDEKGVKGRFSLESLMDEIIRSYGEEKGKRLNVEHLIKVVIDMVPFGIALYSVNGKILQKNKIAQQIIDENLVDLAKIKKMAKDNHPKVLTLNNGTHYRMCINNLQEVDNILVTFTDITTEYEMLQKLRNSQKEVETAFSIMLPDQRLEQRLKSIVEYMDEYDDNTGMIKITGIIKNGCFKHVINMLKLIADAFKQGLMELPGMDKNALVQATILHDIGKVQPSLKIGDIVNPKEVFEKGYLHAFRSADLSKELYNIDTNIYYLIKYHHHIENELPSDFPKFLLPMYRFFRLIDGLSAGITRRGSNISMRIRDTRIFVKEESNFPLYNQKLEMDVYTGFLDSKKL